MDRFLKMVLLAGLVLLVKSALFPASIHATEYCPSTGRTYCTYNSDCGTGHTCSCGTSPDKYCTATQPTDTPPPTATTAPPVYTCINTAGQYCSAEVCSIAGDLPGSGTCSGTLKCCKPGPTPTGGGLPTAGISPTTAPSPTGVICTETTQCEALLCSRCNNCQGSATCNNGACSFTCGLSSDCPGNDWGAWGICTACAQARFCNTNSQAYQIQWCQSGGCGVGPTNTTAPTSTNIPTLTPTPSLTPTPAPGPWIKLKNTSFVSINSLYNYIPVSPAAYDTNDDASPDFIVGSGGLVSAQSINLTGLNAAAKPSANNWLLQGYGPIYSMTPLSYLSYVKARKEFKTIDDLSLIDASGIYFYQGVDPLAISSVPSAFNQYDTVLISQGTISITADFNPAKSIALLADAIAILGIPKQSTETRKIKEIM